MEKATDVKKREVKYLYELEEILDDDDISFKNLFNKVILFLEKNCSRKHAVKVKIIYKTKEYRSALFDDTPYSQSVDIIIQNKVCGKITLFYSEKIEGEKGNQISLEEHILLKNVADRLQYYLQVRDLQEDVSIQKRGDWEIILEMISTTNSNLLLLITKKMLYKLCLTGNKEAQKLMKQFDTDLDEKRLESFGDTNVPLRKKNKESLLGFKNKIFELASRSFPDKQIFSLIERWLHQNNARFLVEALANDNTSLAEVMDAISHYQRVLPDGASLDRKTRRQVIVSFIKRFLTYDLKYRKIAKNFFELDDFQDLLQKIIAPRGVHGRLGGKAAGMFLAQRILKRLAKINGIQEEITIPKTWYISSGAIDSFVHWNSLGDLIEHKYKSSERLRQEYPHIVQVFKNSSFPPEIVNGLSRALDDLHDGPLVVRSSSLLEDSFDASFAGKYKSLFLANQGTKEERLIALMDAIAEIYASVFAPDPLTYRAERGLLDFCEAMGIMIQEVVGKKVDNYFFPPFAGVAFSNNEFRWSRRISKKDGLVRIVPGLGTRAVDRLNDDYPIIVAPGQPGLRANVTPDEMCRYSPHFSDVINLNNNRLETIKVKDLIAKVGMQYPKLKKTVSVYEDGRVIPPTGLDFDEKDLIVTFEGLLSQTSFLSDMKTMLDILEEQFDFPVDLEFAYNGDSIYLLQCRPQSHSEDNISMPIPQDIDQEKVIFSANKYISNGLVPDITHIVYVDPEGYSKLPDMESLIAVGKAVGQLNQILPKRSFILMGPGRWGSRGDIKLGVRACYSDINNTAVLIEIARQKGNYVPELSFGTHFFQDLVEASIRYLPLYPDQIENAFNEKFLLNSENHLAELLPEFKGLEHVVKVIDVPRSSDGQVLRVLMNSDLDQSLAYLTHEKLEITDKNQKTQIIGGSGAWNWRLYMARQLAESMDIEKFGVKNIYVFGSTKNNTATDTSDINLLVHFDGDEAQREELQLWLDGWGQSLSAINFLKTGQTLDDGLLDVHIITDKDIEEKDSYAIKIHAATDPARKLPVTRPRTRKE